MTTPAPPRPAGPPAWAYLLLYAAAALWVDFSHVHLNQRSDTVVFSLASQQAWTPFFWEQDRVGMLVPLLTTACPDLASALLVQTWLTVFVGLCVPFLLAELACPHPAGRAAAAVASVVTLGLAPPVVLNNLLFECCYPQGMALGCLGLLVLARGGDRPRAWRYAAAAGLLVAAHWVYIGVVVWVLPLAVGLAVVRPGRPWPGVRAAAVRAVAHPPSVAAVGLVLAGLVAGLVFMSLAQRAEDMVEPTPQGGLPVWAWGGNWAAFVRYLFRHPGAAEWAAAGAGLAAVGGAGWLARRRAADGYPIGGAVVVLGLAAAAEFLFMGTRDWPSKNHHHPRYILATLLTVQLAFGMLAVAPIAGWVAGRGRWWVFGLAAAGLFAAATAQYGWPHPDNPRADLDAVTGGLTADALAANVDAIGGEYWSVWPAVFHLNATTGRAGDDILYGVTLRCNPFRPRWERTHPHGLRVGVPSDPVNRSLFLFYATERYGLTPPQKVGTQGRLDIYTARPAAAP